MKSAGEKREELDGTDGRRSDGEEGGGRDGQMGGEVMKRRKGTRERGNIGERKLIQVSCYLICLDKIRR